MVATVRLDEKLEYKLNNLVNMLHKKKSEIIREAIEQYANSVETVKKTRFQMAIEKTDEYILKYGETAVFDYIENFFIIDKLAA